MAKSKSYYHTHPRSSQSISKQSVAQQQEEQEEKKRKAVADVSVITSSNQIKRRESYDIYNAETNQYVKTSSGDKLRDSIAHETLSYDKKSKTWSTKRGKYIIRKKR